MGEATNSPIRTANIHGGQISYVELASPIYGYKGKLKRELDDVHRELGNYLRCNANEMLRFWSFVPGRHKRSLPEVCRDVTVYYWQQDGSVANAYLTKQEGKPLPDFITHRALVMIAGQPDATSGLYELLRAEFAILTPTGQLHEMRPRPGFVFPPWETPGRFTFNYLNDNGPDAYTAYQNKRRL